ncbi:enoyl-CoA hydratase/isomerase family protein [Ornithinibacillus californiensis]|uniref:enoyl-CoA hydratase/isomerase family protein n=1 Tax=Ornithinibacillus californiensis TaxID=161536 RepID=UPI00064E0780|nr:enoyl-CoA hydratase/isomerase family protein [Ornithinibacillus californiensis]
MSYQLIDIERRNKGVTWILINNPPANAIGEDLMQEFDHAVEELTNDEATRVVVIASKNPKIFLAGADLKGIVMNSGDMADDDNFIARESARMQDCFQKFADLPKPVIAAINGYALGGGCELALACDFRLMGNGKIGLTEVSLGLIPGAGGTQRMTTILGRAKAMELIFLAKKLEAKEAETIGLIHRAVDAELFEEEVTMFAEELSTGAVHAMGLAKKAINASEKGLAAGLKVEAQAFADTFLTDEPSIGLAAFFQKQKANFLVN